MKAYGEPGVARNIFEIKSAIDKIDSVCKELLAWEYKLQGVIPPDEFKEVAELMKGWSKPIIDTINQFPIKLDRAFSPENLAKGDKVNLNLTFSSPSNIKRVIEIIEEVRLGLI